MTSSTSFILLSNVNLKHSEEFVEIPIEEGIYLAALSRIFSGERPEVSDESLNNILFAAKCGCEDAGMAIKLACSDFSYEEAIEKGEYRAKECLKNRILGTPYKLDFYRPLAIDFPSMIASSSDWRIPFKHISANISYLKSEGDIGYAYAAVQDVCCLYETLKEQYSLYPEDSKFRDNVVNFLFVASRVFANLNNDGLRSQFEKLSSSVRSNASNCITNAQKLFTEAAVVLESK
jgi:hypothetical protein